MRMKCPKNRHSLPFIACIEGPNGFRTQLSPTDSRLNSVNCQNDAYGAGTAISTRNGRDYCGMCMILATAGGTKFAPALEVKDLLREGARSALQPSYVRRLRGLGITRGEPEGGAKVVERLLQPPFHLVRGSGVQHRWASDRKGCHQARILLYCL